MRLHVGLAAVLLCARLCQPITWPKLAGLHPFVPQEQAKGYLRMLQVSPTSKLQRPCPAWLRLLHCASPAPGPAWAAVS